MNVRLRDCRDKLFLIISADQCLIATCSIYYTEWKSYKNVLSQWKGKRIFLKTFSTSLFDLSRESRVQRSQHTFCWDVAVFFDSRPLCNRSDVKRFSLCSNFSRCCRPKFHRNRASVVVLFFAAVGSRIRVLSIAGRRWAATNIRNNYSAIQWQSQNFCHLVKQQAIFVCSRFRFKSLRVHRCSYLHIVSPSYGFLKEFGCFIFLFYSLSIRT